MFAHWLFLAGLDLIIAMLLFRPCSAFRQVQCHRNLWPKTDTKYKPWPPFLSLQHPYFFKHSFHLNAASFNLFLFLFSALFYPYKSAFYKSVPLSQLDCCFIIYSVVTQAPVGLVPCTLKEKMNVSAWFVSSRKSFLYAGLMKSCLAPSWHCIEKMVLYLILTSWLEWKVLCSFPSKVYWRG